MKHWLIGALAVAVFATAMPSISEAKRFGGGKSSGMKRDMPARTAPDAPPARPAQNAAGGTPATPAAAAAPAAAGVGAAAAAGKRSWMGPIAGLAAGLGLVALMSHLGMGEAFANFLMLALLGVAVVFLIVFLMRRFGANKGSALATAASGATSGTNAGANNAVRSAGSAAAWQQASEKRGLEESSPASPSTGSERSAPSYAVGAASDPVMPAHRASNLESSGEVNSETEVEVIPVRAVPKAFVPATFDSESFTRTAKMIFIRLQAANDTADLDDLRRFTTPELFASLRLDIQERGPAEQHTDVVKVDAEVLDVSQDDTQQIVSVRFTGQLVEEKGAAPTEIEEFWHLVKPLDDSRPWAIAGVEQSH